jgi:glycerol-3-phosphate dehydrogenase subunit B
VGLPRIEAALHELRQLFLVSGYPLTGALDKNWLLPTAAGAIRPTFLAPDTMIAGDVRRPEPMLIVGFEGSYDFYPNLVAANLARQGVTADHCWLELGAITGRSFVNATVLAPIDGAAGVSR